MRVNYPSFFFLLLLPPHANQRFTVLFAIESAKNALSHLHIHPRAAHRCHATSKSDP